MFRWILGNSYIIVFIYLVFLLILVASFFQVAKQTAGPAVVLSFAIAGDISDDDCF